MRWKERDSIVARGLRVGVLSLLVFSFTFAEEADARRSRKLRRNNCLNASCTVFINDPFQNALNSLILGARFNGLFDTGRFSLLGSSLLGSSHFGHGFGRFGFGGYRGGHRNRFLDAYIDNLIFRALLGKDRYIPGNPYPNLGLFSALLGGEIGYLPPITNASPNYPYKPKKLEPFVTGGDRPVSPGEPIPTPTPESNAPPAPEELPPPTHGGDPTNSDSARPVAPTNDTTSVEPLSADQRQLSETFPQAGLDWNLQILENAVRQTGAASVLGSRSPNSRLCQRARGHSRRLALESARRRGVVVHHADRPSDVFEIVAGAVANSAAEAASRCVSNWQNSPEHARLMSSSFAQFCYAIVPVGNFYSCTGVFSN